MRDGPRNSAPRSRRWRLAARGCFVVVVTLMMTGLFFVLGWF